MEVKITTTWNSYLRSFPNDKKDIYFTEEYVNLYQNDTNTPLCIVVCSGDSIILMPILRCQIMSSYYDFETPYGYGGFISNTEDEKFITEAIAEVLNFLSNNNYIAGFVRFHPLLNNSALCKNNFKVIDDRITIAMDLRPSELDIWMQQVYTKNRNTIKKASKNGLEFIADHNFDYIDSFIELYNQTMDKLGADGFYYFDKKYYQKWIETLKNRSFLAVVKYNGIVISACIIMYERPYGHYHLSGSNREFLRLEPNNFMLWNAAMELKRLGINYFHLGGGINSDPENNLLKFKERMSPNKYQFSFGKMIFNEEIYNQICNKWAAQNPEKAEKFRFHLLKYRY